MKLYKTVSLAFAIIFAIVGLAFLSIPGSVIKFFNQISAHSGFPSMPIVGLGFYNILTIGYMYVVTLLAVLMARHPENSMPPLLLINAKSCSSILSFAMLIIVKPYLIFLVNGIIDGAIAVIVAITFIRMKNGSLNPRLAFASLYLPTHIKAKNLTQLFDLTARAFSTQAPDLDGLTYNERLDRFALFTKNAGENAIFEKNDLEAIKKDLYEGSHRMGAKLREELKVRNRNDVLASCRILYNALEIDFHGEPDGRVSIRRCFFSDYYSAEICELISSIDCGLVAGLSQGDHLYFHERITDGHKYCQARLVKSENSE